MSQDTICLLGGTGFVGQHLVHSLTEAGYRVRVLTRRRERHRALIVNPAVTLIEADAHNEDALRQHFSGCDAVINLVAILNDSTKDGSGFQQVHVALPEKIVAAALATGVPRLLHMSALNADPGEAHCLYLKSKGEGEDIMHNAAGKGLVVTSFRPSVIFGPGDSFFNRFASLLKLSRPVMPLACPGSRFAPVYVGDVCKAMARSLDNATGGERLDLCGPESYTLKELVEYTRDQLGICCAIAGLGDGMSRLQARILGMMPGQPFTLDNYHALQHDSVCNENALPGLGITPAPIDAIVPAYLCNHTSRGRYDDYRREARRQGS
jgi:NADH dehydrogenase